MEERYTLKKPASVKGRKRVGRGGSSGHGKTSCRGGKGQTARSGSGRPANFEGGQMPIQRRIPKRGFNNTLKVYFRAVNLADLGKVSVNEITPAVLAERGIIKHEGDPVKVLAKGEIGRAVTVTADSFSASAREKILKAGGACIIRKAAAQG